MAGVSRVVCVILRAVGCQAQLLPSGKQMSDDLGLQTLSPTSPQLGLPPTSGSLWASISPLLSPASSAGGGGARPDCTDCIPQAGFRDLMGRLLST